MGTARRPPSYSRRPETVDYNREREREGVPKASALKFTFMHHAFPRRFTNTSSSFVVGVSKDSPLKDTLHFKSVTNS